MATLTYLDLNTSHLQKSTLNPTPHPSYLLSDYPEGAFFYVPSDHHLDSDTPPDLALVLGYAKALGCTIVRFDADAEQMDQLPVFNWE